MIRIMNLSEVDKSEILFRKELSSEVEDIVSDIIRRVRKEGDKALYELTEKFDKAKLESLLVSEEEIDEAFKAVEPEFVRILETAKKNIVRFHERQKRNSFILNEEEGVVVGQKIIPVEKAGLYVPGGSAAYPSTVLMDALPAKIAGVEDLVMVTPPLPSGKVNPYILASARIAGIDRIFKVGGAQAIAALAYGTESIPRVDKIVGPGNAFVAEAKKQVFGRVSIDMIAGPSEILVIADGNTDAHIAAADMLSQAEHDRNATSVLVTDSSELALKVQAELEEQIEKLPRKEIARASIEDNGKIIITRSIDEAVEISNELAPEHLELLLDEPFDYLDRIRNAGSVFMGRNCPEVLGDYYAGPNHTLPTSGSARFSSPLGVDDFIKKTQYTYYSKKAFEKVASDIAFFAEKEGLGAHARSALVRLEV